MSMTYNVIILKKNNGDNMKTRAQAYGNSNMIGKRVYELRTARSIKQKELIAQLQAAGLDINPSSYSKLEGQVRNATDKEVFYIAKVLNVSMEELFDNKN